MSAQFGSRPVAARKRRWHVIAGDPVGKAASVRVYPTSMLESVPAWGLELEPTRGATHLAVGRVGAMTVLAVLVRKQVVLLHIDDRRLFPKLAVRRASPVRVRHAPSAVSDHRQRGARRGAVRRPLQEFAIADMPVSFAFAGPFLCMGAGPRVRVANLAKIKQPVTVDLPSREDRAVAWVHHAHGLTAVAAFRLPNEFLLCYNSAWLSRALRWWRAQSRPLWRPGGIVC